MRADLVVVLSPALRPLTSVVDVEERVGVEQLVVDAAVERLDLSVLGGPARLNELQIDRLGRGPLQNSPARELRTVVRSERGRRPLNERRCNLLISTGGNDLWDRSAPPGLSRLGLRST